MDKILKYGLIALIIYFIFTPLGIFINQNAHKILTDADILQIPAGVMAGIFFITNSFFSNNFISGTHEFNFSNIISFIIGALIYFLIGNLIGFFVNKMSEKSQNHKEIFNKIGKRFIIWGVILLIVGNILLFGFCYINSISRGHSGNDCGIVLIVTLLVMGPPALILYPIIVLGIIFWIVSKFMKE